MSSNYLGVACTFCGAGIDERCTWKDGKKTLHPSQSHKARKEAWTEATLEMSAALQKADDEGPVSRLFEDDAPLTETVAVAAGSRAQSEWRQVAEQRKWRIAAVLSGIAFARKVGAPQDEIDRNLAALIVDGGLDTWKTE